MGERGCFASPGKIIVKALVEERRGQPKGRINLDVSESRMVQQGCNVGKRGRGRGREGRRECAAAVRHPRFISCSVSRGKLQRRLRFPLRMHFKRLRTNRKWHSQLYFSSCTPLLPTLPPFPPLNLVSLFLIISGLLRTPRVFSISFRPLSLRVYVFCNIYSYINANGVEKHSLSSLLFRGKN